MARGVRLRVTVRERERRHRVLAVRREGTRERERERGGTMGRAMTVRGSLGMSGRGARAMGIGGWV